MQPWHFFVGLIPILATLMSGFFLSLKAVAGITTVVTEIKFDVKATAVVAAAQAEVLEKHSETLSKHSEQLVRLDERAKMQGAA